MKLLGPACRRQAQAWTFAGQGAGPGLPPNLPELPSHPFWKIIPKIIGVYHQTFNILQISLNQRSPVDPFASAGLAPFLGRGRQAEPAAGVLAKGSPERETEGLTHPFFFFIFCLKRMIWRIRKNSEEEDALKILGLPLGTGGML